MSDRIPHFPQTTYKLQFKPLDTTKCIHAESFAAMDYSLQLDYAKLYLVPHAETLDREALVDLFCNGNKWIIALKHPEHEWRPSRSGGIVVTRNRKAAAAVARLAEEERAVEEELIEDLPVAERFPSPGDEYEGPTPPPENPPTIWEPPVPVHLELTYPPQPRDLGVNAQGERITEPVPEDYLGVMVQESLHSFEGMKSKVQAAIDDTNAALADVLKFQARLNAQRAHNRDLMETMYSIVGPEVARKLEEAVKRAMKDGVLEEWEEPDVFGQEEKEEEEETLKEDDHLPDVEGPSRVVALKATTPQQNPATQHDATRTRPRTFLVPELPSRFRSAIDNDDHGEGSSMPIQNSRPRSQSSSSSTSSKRSREDDDDAVDVQPNKGIVVYGSFRDAVAHMGNYRKKARRGESPFNKTTAVDGGASDSSSSFSLSGGVPWNLYQINDEADEADEADSTYSPSSDSDSDDSSLSLNFYDSDHAPLSPSGLSDLDSDGDAPSGSSQSSSSFFGSQGTSGSQPKHPTGPRPPAPPPRQHEQTAKKLKRNDNRIQVNPETGKAEIVQAADDPARGQRSRAIPIQAERIEDILDDIVSCNNKFEFDEEAWKCFEIPE